MPALETVKASHSINLLSSEYIEHSPSGSSISSGGGYPGYTVGWYENYKLLPETVETFPTFELAEAYANWLKTKHEK